MNEPTRLLYSTVFLERIKRCSQAPINKLDQTLAVFFLIECIKAVLILTPEAYIGVRQECGTNLLAATLLDSGRPIGGCFHLGLTEPGRLTL